MNLTESTRIEIATAPMDFRCGIDGFVACCQHRLGQNPRSGTWFVFINRGRTMIRILVYDRNGYWLMTKRLSSGRYQGWPGGESPLRPMAAHRLRQLLNGLLDSRDD